MMHRFIWRLFFPLLLATLTVTPQASADEFEPDTQVGDFVFRKPISWKRVDKDGATVYVSPAPNPGKNSLFVFFTRDLKGTLRAAFDAEWADLCRNYRVVKMGNVASQHSPRGFDYLATEANLSDRAGVPWVVFFMTAQFQNRVETLMFLTSDLDPGMYRVSMEQLNRTLASLRFSGTPAEPRAVGHVGDAGITLPKSSGPYNGVYRAVVRKQITYRAITGDPYNEKIGWAYVTFLPDGRFYEGSPLEGLDQMDEDREIRVNPVGWGTYEMRGDAGVIVFAKTNPSEKEPIVWDVTPHGDELNVHGNNYHRLDPCNGLRLQGTYQRPDAAQLFPGARQRITFTEDGRFADEGVFKAAAVMHHSVSGWDFDDGEPGNGNYRINNYTLELKYSNGRTKKSFFFLDEKMPKTDVQGFNLNTYGFVRVR